MSRTPTITREAILDAAVALVREEGHEQLNARALAARLGCSTQPVLYCFKTMDELRQEAYAVVDQLHTAFLMQGLDAGGDDDPLLLLGLNYVRFACEEPRYFRFLFQTDGLGQQDMMALVADPGLAPLIQAVAQEANLEEDAARQAFLAIFATAHGFASLLANNALEYNEEQVASALTGSFLGAAAPSATALWTPSSCGSTRAATRSSSG